MRHNHKSCGACPQKSGGLLSAADQAARKGYEQETHLMKGEAWREAGGSELNEPRACGQATSPRGASEPRSRHPGDEGSRRSSGMKALDRRAKANVVSPEGVARAAKRSLEACEESRRTRQANSRGDNARPSWRNTPSDRTRPRSAPQDRTPKTYYSMSSISTEGVARAAKQSLEWWCEDGAMARPRMESEARQVGRTLTGTHHRPSCTLPSVS